MIYGEKPVVCEYCGEIFTDEHLLMYLCAYFAGGKVIPSPLYCAKSPDKKHSLKPLVKSASGEAEE